MIELRDYQQKAIIDLQDEFGRGFNHIILQAPTGSGKTVIFSELSRRVSQKNKKVLILTDRAELLQQAGGTLKRVGLQSFYIQAGCKIVNNNFSTYIAMSETLRRRIEKKQWIEFINSIDLFIVDECHKQSFNYIFETGLLDKKYVIGFTATPKRSGKQRQLALDYQKIIPTISVKNAINSGYLVNDDYYGVAAPDLSDVGVDYKTGDYREGQMFKKFNSPKLYAGVIENYKKITPNTKTLCFCVNIEHVVKTCKAFNDSGIEARFIVSGLSKPKKPNEQNEGNISRYSEKLRIYELYKKAFDVYSGARSDVFKWFNETKTGVLVNAGITTTGFDQPDIETVIIDRATLSMSLWLQMLGRGSRLSHGKTHFNILDFGGNADRLGHYSENRTWSLWHEESKGEGLPTLKECGFDNKGLAIINEENKKGCRRLILASYKICPFCGYIYPKKELFEVDLSGIAFDFEAKKAKKTKRIKDMNFQELKEYREMKGHKSAWLWRQLWIRGGEKEIREFGSQYGWKYATIDRAVGFCRGL